MKTCLLLLIPLVLWLSVMPCCGDEVQQDSPICLEDQGSSEKETENHAPCSPFYSCGTCSGFILEGNNPLGWISEKQNLPVLFSEPSVNIPHGSRSSILKPPSHYFFNS